MFDADDNRFCLEAYWSQKCGRDFADIFEHGSDDDEGEDEVIEDESPPAPDRPSLPLPPGASPHAGMEPTVT